ncbi:hypothetical protein SORBI_3003G377600 [Sorghum bicolor]|nr:hypothetical protein SORBI_3003G377600 [Sorghum bicolor]
MQSLNLVIDMLARFQLTIKEDVIHRMDVLNPQMFSLAPIGLYRHA